MIEAAFDCANRLFGMGQQLDRVAQHVLPGCQKFGDYRGGHAFLGHLDGGFDHRQDKTFDAIAVLPDVALLGFQQAGHQVIGLGIVAQQVCEPLLRQAIKPLVMPKRVIGIEGNAGQRAHPDSLAHVFSNFSQALYKAIREEKAHWHGRCR